MEKDLKIDDCHLMFGDCLERMKEIPDGSVELVIADPPILEGRGSRVGLPVENGEGLYRMVLEMD